MEQGFAGPLVAVRVRAARQGRALRDARPQAGRELPARHDEGVPAAAARRGADRDRGRRPAWTRTRSSTSSRAPSRCCRSAAPRRPLRAPASRRRCRAASSSAARSRPPRRRRTSRSSSRPPTASTRSGATSCEFLADGARRPRAPRDPREEGRRLLAAGRRRPERPAAGRRLHPHRRRVRSGQGRRGDQRLPRDRRRRSRRAASSPTSSTGAHARADADRPA